MAVKPLREDVTPDTPMDAKMVNTIGMFVRSYLKQNAAQFKGDPGDRGDLGPSVDEQRVNEMVDECMRRYRVNHFGGMAQVGRIDSSAVDFVQSGSGASAETTQNALRRLPHTAQYDTAANFNTKRASLTGTQGISPQLQFANIDPTETIPAGLIYGGATFNGTYDPVFYHGYNIGGSTGDVRIDNSEPSLKVGLEGDYNSGSSRLMEYNLDYLSADGGTSRRGLSFTIDRSTHEVIGAVGCKYFRVDASTVGASAYTVFDMAGAGSKVFYIRHQGGSGVDIALGGDGTATAPTNIQIGTTIIAGTGVYAQWNSSAFSVIGGPARITDGLVSAPSLAFTSENNSGIYRSASAHIDFALTGFYVAGVNFLGPGGTGAISVLNSGVIGFNSSTTPTSIMDVWIARSAQSNLAITGVTGASVIVKQATTTLSNVSGASVTATNLIPANSELIGVVTRTTAGLGTSNGTTGYTIGDGSDADRWGAITGTIAGTTSKQSDATADPRGWFGSAQNVVITASGGNFDGTGDIRVIALYLDTGAPTS